MSKWKVHARGLTRDKMKLHSEHADEHSASKQARDLYERGWHSVSVTSPDGKDSSKWASADMATKKSEDLSKALDPKHIESTIQGIKGSYGDKYSEADHTSFRERAKHAKSHKHLAQMVENHYDLDPADARDMAAPTHKAEKHWHIEVLEKMPMKPAGQLANGKHFYSMVHHPAHATFTAQDHAEASKHLHDHAVAEWQKGHENDDGFGINHARSLAIAAKGHAQQAKAKGLPKHNNPKR